MDRIQCPTSSRSFAILTSEDAVSTPALKSAHMFQDVHPLAVTCDLVPSVLDCRRSKNRSRMSKYEADYGCNDNAEQISENTQALAMNDGHSPSFKRNEQSLIVN